MKHCKLEKELQMQDNDKRRKITTSFGFVRKQNEYKEQKLKKILRHFCKHKKSQINGMFIQKSEHCEWIKQKSTLGWPFIRNYLRRKRQKAERKL